MKAFSRSSGLVLGSLLACAVFAGCGGGGSGGLQNTTIPLPAGSAAFSLKVANNLSSNYAGPNIKTTGAVTHDSGSNFYQFFGQVPQAGSTPENFKGTSVLFSLLGALKQGKIYSIDTSEALPGGGGATADVAYFDGVSPTNLRWSSDESGRGGLIFVKSLSATSVTLQVSNVVLPARANSTTRGAVTLNGTITATLPQ